jgi:hypothetical protein
MTDDKNDKNDKNDVDPDVARERFLEGFREIFDKLWAPKAKAPRNLNLRAAKTKEIDRP